MIKRHVYSFVQILKKNIFKYWIKNEKPSNMSVEEQSASFTKANFSIGHWINITAVGLINHWIEQKSTEGKKNKVCLSISINNLQFK